MNTWRTLSAAAALAASFVASPSGDYVEGDLNYTNASNHFADGVEDDSQGLGLAARGRVFVEGDYFVHGDAELHFTEGTTGGSNYDLDSQLYRLGLGAQDYAGSRNLLAAFWVEVVYSRIDLATAAGNADTDDVGGGVQLRFDRATREGRFLPYLQLGYVSTDDFDGGEARLGTRLNLPELQPYAELRYLDRDGDGNAFEQLSFAAGVRLGF